MNLKEFAKEAAGAPDSIIRKLLAGLRKIGPYKPYNVRSLLDRNEKLKEMSRNFLKKNKDLRS